MIMKLLGRALLWLFVSVCTFSAFTGIGFVFTANALAACVIGSLAWLIVAAIGLSHLWETAGGGRSPLGLPSSGASHDQSGLVSPRRCASRQPLAPTAPPCDKDASKSTQYAERSGLVPTRC
jgi:hypothetical protein